MSVVSADISQPSVPDRLAGALLRHLHRRHRQVEIGGAGRALLGAVLTFGLWPMIRWPRRFRDFVVIQQMQAAHLADWMSEAVGAETAKPLRAAADRVRFRNWLWVLSLIAAGAMIADFAVHIDRYSLTFGHIITITWGYDRATQATGGIDQRLHLIWLAGLSAAYLLHFAQVKLHARDMRRVIDAFNDLTRREQLAMVVPAAARYRLISPWTVGMLLLGVAGAWWGVAMMLAGGAQRAYTSRTTPATRRSLAEALRTMLLLRRPDMRVPTTVWMTRRCPNERCGHHAPADADFCPRCGSPMNIPTIDTRG